MTLKYPTPEQVKVQRLEQEELRKFRITKKELGRLGELICEILLPSVFSSSYEIKPLPDEIISFEWKDYFDLKLDIYFEKEQNKTFRELLDESGWQIVVVENKGFLLQPKEPI